MFLIGISSLIQCWFLPGLLILAKFKKIGILDKFILSLPISIIANYILVILLLNFKLFDQKVLIGIIIFEFLLAVYFYKNYFKNIFKIQTITFQFNLINILNIILIFVFLYLASKSIGIIIHSGDPYVMWNKWAISIFENSLPVSSLDYPLGYPILQSISYKIIGTYEIEFFSQALQIIYPLFSIVALLRILVITKNNLFKYVLLFSLLLILNQFRHTLFIGFVDPILVFNSIILIYLIFLIKENKNLLNDKIFLIILGIVLSASGIIKQTGLYISFIAPLVLFFCLDLKYKLINFKNLIILFFVIFLLVTPLYLYKFYLYIYDSGSLNALNLISLQEEKTFLEKISRTSKLIFGLGLFVIIPILIFAAKNKISRIFLLFIIMPYFLIWSFFYGNDARNFALILPFIAFCIADLLYDLEKNFLIKLSNKFSNIFSYILVILLIAFISEKRDFEYMYKKNKEQMENRTPHKKVNILLNHYKKVAIKDSNIFFSDNSFSYLPKFKNGKFLLCNESTSKFLKNENEKIFYLYNKKNCQKEFLDSYFIKNESKIIFDEYNFVLISNY